MALLCLLDAVFRDGRSPTLVGTRSPIVMSHPGADRLWIDEDGLTRMELDDIPHWRDIRRFLRKPQGSLRRLRA